MNVCCEFFHICSPSSAFVLFSPIWASASYTRSTKNVFQGCTFTFSFVKCLSIRLRTLRVETKNNDWSTRIARGGTWKIFGWVYGRTMIEVIGTETIFVVGYRYIFFSHQIVSMYANVSCGVGNVIVYRLQNRNSSKFIFQYLLLRNLLCNFLR